jgi:RimJ/RimL family protein N-acetyltransferase
MINLETKRLIIRDFRLEDAASLAQHINHPLISHLTANIPHPYTLEMAEKYMQEDLLEQVKDPRTNYRFAIQLKESADVIGSIGLHKVDWKNSRADIGYWLGVDYHRKAIMSEAEEALLKFVFEEIKLHKVYGTALAINEGSNALFRKFGFEQVGVFKRDRLKDGIWVDAILWELLQEDYRRRK